MSTLPLNESGAAAAVAAPVQPKKPKRRNRKGKRTGGKDTPVVSEKSTESELADVGAQPDTPSAAHDATPPTHDATPPPAAPPATTTTPQPSNPSLDLEQQFAEVLTLHDTLTAAHKTSFTDRCTTFSKVPTLPKLVASDPKPPKVMLSTGVKTTQSYSTPGMSVAYCTPALFIHCTKDLHTPFRLVAELTVRALFHGRLALDKIDAVLSSAAKNAPDEQKPQEYSTMLLDRLSLLKRAKLPVKWTRGDFKRDLVRTVNACKLPSLEYLLDAMARVFAHGVFVREFFAERVFGYGLYHYASSLNHSCEPNCVFAFRVSPNQTDQHVGPAMRLLNIRALRADEELTVNYMQYTMFHSPRAFVPVSLPMKCDTFVLDEPFCACDACVRAAQALVREETAAKVRNHELATCTCDECMRCTHKLLVPNPLFLPADLARTLNIDGVVLAQAIGLVNQNKHIEACHLALGWRRYTITSLNQYLKAHAGDADAGKVAADVHELTRNITLQAAMFLMRAVWPVVYDFMDFDGEPEPLKNELYGRRKDAVGDVEDPADIKAREARNTAHATGLNERGRERYAKAQERLQAKHAARKAVHRERLSKPKPAELGEAPKAPLTEAAATPTTDTTPSSTEKPPRRDMTWRLAAQKTETQRSTLIHIIRVCRSLQELYTNRDGYIVAPHIFFFVHCVVNVIEMLLTFAIVQEVVAVKLTSGAKITPIESVLIASHLISVEPSAASDMTERMLRAEGPALNTARDMLSIDAYANPKLDSLYTSFLYNVMQVKGSMMHRKWEQLMALREMKAPVRGGGAETKTQESKAVNEGQETATATPPRITRTAHCIGIATMAQIETGELLKLSADDWKATQRVRAVFCKISPIDGRVDATDDAATDSTMEVTCYRCGNRDIVLCPYVAPDDGQPEACVVLSWEDMDSTTLRLFSAPRAGEFRVYEINRGGAAVEPVKRAKPTEVLPEENAVYDSLENSVDPASDSDLKQSEEWMAALHNAAATDVVGNTMARFGKGTNVDEADEEAST